MSPVFGGRIGQVGQVGQVGQASFARAPDAFSARPSRALAPQAQAR
jgi:hypothetical protein